jgi:hypothetical protein
MHLNACYVLQTGATQADGATTASTLSFQHLLLTILDANQFLSEGSKQVRESVVLECCVAVDWL